MEKKQEYIAPAVLDELLLEMEGQILLSSSDPVDDNFEDVETMGQDIGGTIKGDSWTHEW